MKSQLRVINECRHALMGFSRRRFRYTYIPLGNSHSCDLSRDISQHSFTVVSSVYCWSHSSLNEEVNTNTFIWVDIIPFEIYSMLLFHAIYNIVAKNTLLNNYSKLLKNVSKVTSLNTSVAK